MVIYKTKCLITKLIYIGKDKYNNPDYIGSGSLLKVDIKKYGKENFVKDILEFCTSKEHMNERERYWISYYNSMNRNIGYNLTEGGDWGEMSEDRRTSKVSYILRYGEEQGIIKYNEYLDKLSRSNKSTSLKGFISRHGEEGGLKKYNEYCKKISKARLGKHPWNYGKTKDTDCRIVNNSKLSGLSRRGKKQSTESNIKRSKAMKGKTSPMKGKPAWNKGLTKETDERVKKISNTRTGKTYGPYV